MANPNVQKRIKVGATLLVLGALVLQLLQWVVLLPAPLQVLVKVTQVILAFHAVEGLVAAVLIFRYKLRPQGGSSGEAGSLLMSHLPESLPMSVLKAGMYIFFVGTVGLVEVIKGVKPVPKENQLVK